ncbi:DUF6578 domain-containing protein [Bacteroides sp. 224]|uniref:DUF6578 domain-containing protein n=1 Tax=Bacteroides sp. 224 TaxID=2302936 RepID=UPI0013D30C42|nr:DUF6578 domain-containing protein [Bacteroides sp. 224]NDV66677.1 hypothetical protein [Bacteroides sp. 224]
MKKYTIIIEAWQMQCCGTPFQVGDAVEWTVIKWGNEKLLVDVGKIDFYYENHADIDTQIFKLKGNVTSILAIHYAYRKSKTSNLMIPASGITVEKTQVDGWDKKVDEKELYAYFVCLTDCEIS